MLDTSFLPQKLIAQIKVHNAMLVMSRGVRLVQPYDLRTPLQIKAEDTIPGNDWTAFVNRTVTLIHVMRHDCPHILIRIPLKKRPYTNLVEFIKKCLYEDLL